MREIITDITNEVIFEFETNDLYRKRKQLQDIEFSKRGILRRSCLRIVLKLENQV